MEDYADSIAGRVGYGLNVEQRKKLSIATELVARPSLLLFLDEPTSGLDSESSYAIIRVLKDLARAGQAILCTIHQPSVMLFEQFDRLLLLKKGGQTVYFGDIGPDSKTIIDYFEKHGGRICGASENPAEYILDVVDTSEIDWFGIWKNSDEFQHVATEIDELNASTFEKPVGGDAEWNGRPYLMPGFWKFMWRTSPITYFLANLLGVVIHDRPVICSQTEYNFLQPPTNMTCGDYLDDYFETHTGYVNNPDESSNCEVCAYNVGDDFINSIGIYYSDRWRNVDRRAILAHINDLGSPDLVTLTKFIGIPTPKSTPQFLQTIGTYLYYTGADTSNVATVAAILSSISTIISKEPQL
ncbi:hypothetical protein CANINC_000483 [Pichia inconspicua]|uniref:ABC transporter family G domain-containing protein n=1 Tax=Pichia inconspicua TaxID=52247 RepID=A0A4V4NG78_9ASCO|nr:hypothetical protein CANINC_000483 [[Candida] inconspicua]